MSEAPFDRTVTRWRAAHGAHLKKEPPSSRRSARRQALADPLVMGVDVARFGDDASVICFRRGRDARTLPWIVLRGVDLMTLAARVAEEKERHHPDAIFVDGDGLGGGVTSIACLSRWAPVFTASTWVLM